MLGKITFGPFVEEPEEDDEEDEIGESSSLFSYEPRYWSSANIPFSMEGSILLKLEQGILKSRIQWNKSTKIIQLNRTIENGLINE